MFSQIGTKSIVNEWALFCRRGEGIPSVSPSRHPIHPILPGATKCSPTALTSVPSPNPTRLAVVRPSSGSRATTPCRMSGCQQASKAFQSSSPQSSLVIGGSLSKSRSAPSARLDTVGHTSCAPATALGANHCPPHFYRPAMCLFQCQINVCFNVLKRHTNRHPVLGPEDPQPLGPPTPNPCTSPPPPGRPPAPPCPTSPRAHGTRWTRRPARPSDRLWPRPSTPSSWRASLILRPLHRILENSP